MYANGSPVTLKVRKTHKLNDNDQLELRPGILGLISRSSRSADGNHDYIVNFGAQGEWNCLHNELDGEDQEQGWDSDEIPLQPINLEPLIRRQGEFMSVETRPSTNQDMPMTLDEPNYGKEALPKIIDIEADIARRMKELERK